VQDDVERHAREMEDQEREVEEYVDDSEVMHDVHDDFEDGGSTEASDAVKQAFQDARDRTAEGFEREDQELEGIHDGSTEHENELDGRAETTESDAKRIDDARSRVDTSEPVDGLERGHREEQEDTEFFRGQEQEEHEAHEGSDRHQEALRRRLEGARF